MSYPRKREKDINIRRNFLNKEINSILYKYYNQSNFVKNKKKFFINFKFIKIFHLSSSQTRAANRCLETNNSRWVLRRFKLSRVQFKSRVDKGDIIGVRRATW